MTQKKRDKKLAKHFYTMDIPFLLHSLLGLLVARARSTVALAGRAGSIAENTREDPDPL